MSLAGNWIGDLEVRTVGQVPAAAAAQFPLVETKCRDMLLIVEFDNAADGNDISEIALGDASDGSDLQPLDISGILDESGAKATEGIVTTKRFVFLLKEVCRKYVRVTTASVAAGNVRMLAIQANCRNYPRVNDAAQTDGPADQKAFTVACTCP